MKVWMRVSLLFTLSLSAGLSPTAYAWDAHHLLTRQSLQGFQGRTPALWSELNTPVTVTPIEQFVAKAFGERCTLSRMQDHVLEGLGINYKIFYTPAVSSTSQIDWERGINRVLTLPLAGATQATNPHAIGHALSPLEIVSVYSDEPDWGMDDDVPALKGKGLAESTEGSSTRVLRHFWYGGETVLGVDFGKDQETDRRMQLYYEMALVAFSVGEPYWGWRFLGNALHYLQDITQPFHSRAILSDKMISKLKILQLWLCERRHACPAGESLGKEIIKSGWAVGAYHAAYEDFARGLLLPGSRFPFGATVADYDGSDEAHGYVEVLPWKTSASEPLLDLPSVIRAVQLHTASFAEALGDAVYEAFGWSYRSDTNAMRQQVLQAGSTQSIGYRIAMDFGVFPLPLTERQVSAIAPMVEHTRQAMMRAGIWGRQFVYATAESRNDSSVQKTVHTLREDFAKKCEAPLPSKPLAAILIQ